MRHRTWHIASLLLAACSAEPNEGEETRVVNATTALEEVQDDDTEFQTEVIIDREGKVTRTVTRGNWFESPGFDASKLPVKPVELTPTPPKVTPSLKEKLRLTDPNATSEVLVSVVHDAPFSRLPKLHREQSRESTENQRVLSARVAEIAAVEARRRPFRNDVVEYARSLGATVIEEFTMGNGLLLSIPDTAVDGLAAHPNVLNISARYGNSRPPATISNGRSSATGMNSDGLRPYYDGYRVDFYALLLDTGVRSAHTVFNSTDGGILGYFRDCAHGDNYCVNLNPPNPGYNTQDPLYGHGTAAASIMIGGNSSSSGFGLPFRGVSKTTLDYINVWLNGVEDQVDDPTAAVRAFGVAPLWGDDLIVAELQMPMPENSTVSRAADDAFDLGIAVIGACGNVGAVTSPSAPGNAHKALSIGDYDAVSGSTVWQVPGSVGGRIKPDIQAPTNVDAAGNANNTAKWFGFNGTSGATAFAGGAAALVYHFLAAAAGHTNEPGLVYTTLLAQGDGNSITNGVGKLKLYDLNAGIHFWLGTKTVNTSTVTFPITVPANRKNLQVAIWWPEKDTDAHNDVDLVVRGAHPIQFSSAWGGSVWEKTTQSGNLTPGNYEVDLIPYSMPRPGQIVYYTIIAALQ